MRLLAMSDRVAGRTAWLLASFGQVALVFLGVHLAADRLDDMALAGLTIVDQWLDQHLAGALVGLAEWVHLSYDAFLVWDHLPLPALAAWLALAIELVTVGLLSVSFLLTERRPVLRWSCYRRALSLWAILLPFCLAGVLLAGSWSLSMAAEDLLPAAPLSRWVAWALGAAVALRFGVAAWVRAVASLERPRRLGWSVLGAVLLVPVGLVAWVEGVPVWGWLP